MKLDDDVKMISAEAPMLFAKAAEIFIHELTLRAWVHTEDNKRRTLQVSTSLHYSIFFPLLWSELFVNLSLRKLNYMRTPWKGHALC
jgi:hypothetical protein